MDAPLDPLARDPFQEYQVQDPRQGRQIRTEAPPFAGQQEFAPTPATSIDEVLKAAYFVATGIDAPVVEVVNPHVINLYYPADGSLATVRIEGRSGAWGGIGPKSSTPEEEADRNTHYDEMKAAAAAPPPPEGGVTRREEQEQREPVYSEPRTW